MEQHKTGTNSNHVILSLKIKIIILMTVLVAATIMIASYLFILREDKVIQDRTQQEITRATRMIKAIGHSGNYHRYQSLFNGNSRVSKLRVQPLFMIIEDLRTKQSDYIVSPGIVELVDLDAQENSFDHKKPEEIIATIKEKLAKGELSSDDIRIEQMNLGPKEQHYEDGRLRLTAVAEVGYSLEKLKSKGHSARSWIFVMAASLITFGALGAVIFAHNLTKPIHRLVQATQEVSAGNFDQYVEPATKDEIGFLTTNFNQMVNGLKERQQLEKELALAREIQTNLLPEIPPCSEAFEIAALNIPCNGVSGDFYDFIPIADEQVGVIIGDVSGKGMPAALLMTSVRASMRARMDNGYCTSEIITRLNDSIWQDTSSTKFVTLFYCVLDLQNKTVTYCNAGHNPPILLRNAEAECEFLEVGGIPLGMFSSQEYTEGTIQLEEDDVVVLYTDGVTEAMNSNEEFFGDEKLQSIIKKHSSHSAAELLDEIRSQVDSFTGDASLFDDVTLVIIKAS